MDGFLPHKERLHWALLKVFVILVLSGLILYSSAITGKASQILHSEEEKGNRGIVIEEVDLDFSEKSILKELGLTPRNPLKVVSLNGQRTIHGRFLHITDMHPDPYYKAGTKQEKSCHSGSGNAGKYGDAISGCDSPMILMEDTINWIKDKFRDRIDFIVWTGDNIRHDNDRKYPRTEANIFEMNEHVSNLMFDAFKSNESDDPFSLKVPLVPSLGNNDVFPHNLFAPGPTLQTRELFRIWKNYIPPSQLHIFSRGAYYFQEIIPNQLAVISINTLYFFQSNPLVDNCDGKKQPGYKLFEWLGFVLKEMRARNMKVWLTGHVPPNKKNYDISCLRKYVAWVHQYRDIVLGGLYGHMNLDHFIPLDSVKAYKSIKKHFGDIDYEANYEDYLDVNESDYEDEENEIIHEHEENSLDQYINKDIFRAEGGIPNGKVSYMNSLRENLYATIKGKRKSGAFSQRYAISHVSTSIVPTFNPGFRVWEYNITGLKESLSQQNKFAPWNDFFQGVEKHLNYDLSEEDLELNQTRNLKKHDNTFPPQGPFKGPLGPAYVPQTFTPERYIQYYADLEAINKGKKLFAYEIEYKTDDSVYDMESLTVDEWIKLGRRLGRPIKDEKKKKKKSKNKNKKKIETTLSRGNLSERGTKKDEVLWSYYLKNSFVSSNYENMGYG